MNLRWGKVLTSYVLERIHHHLRPPQARVFEENLVLLHDTLEASPLAGLYWVWGGVLLGWAREGRILKHDRDADFAVSRRHLDAFRSSIECLNQRGFTLSRAFVNNDQRITEYVFVRDYIKFEFFIVDDDEDAIRYWTYYPPDKVQLECSIPGSKLAPMRLLDRTWLKPEDHEAHLTAVYGDWRTPREDYWYVDDERSIIKRLPWTGGVLWAPGIGDIR
jgi:hypothetical protein